jgi:hypothetical protein
MFKNLPILPCKKKSISENIKIKINAIPVLPSGVCGVLYVFGYKFSSSMFKNFSQ